MDDRILRLFDEYTHAPLPRRVFLERLTALAGSAAAAAAILPLLDSNYAHAAVPADDPRLAASRISYPAPSGTMGGYLVVPKEGPGRRGGVVVVHENRGLTPHIEDVARRVALAGFNALAVDLLAPHGGTPADEDKGRELFAAKVDRNTAWRDVAPAVALLAGRPDANGKVGVMGFCFGGGLVNDLAVNVPALAAGVVFYGRAPSSADVPRIRAAMLLHYAGNDPGINAGMAGYEAALKGAGVRYEQHVYDGTQHAFHNDTGGARYDKAAAELAWSRTVAFLKRELG
jgi:carboxymethylenebutenolidase